MLGRTLLPRGLLDHDVAAGELALSWEGSDNAGRTLPAGLYVARLSQDDEPLRVHPLRPPHPWHDRGP